MNWDWAAVGCLSLVALVVTWVLGLHYGAESAREDDKDKAEASQKQAREWYEESRDENNFLARIYRRELMRILEAKGVQIPLSARMDTTSFVLWLRIMEAKRASEEVADALRADAIAIQHATDEALGGGK